MPNHIKIANNQCEIESKDTKSQKTATEKLNLHFIP